MVPSKWHNIMGVMEVNFSLKRLLLSENLFFIIYCPQIVQSDLPHHSVLACTLVWKVPSDIAKIFYELYNVLTSLHAETKQFLIFRMSIS